MKKFTAIIVAALTVTMSAHLRAQTLNWGSAAFSDLVDSNGDVLGSNYVFELGTFGSFVPNSSNVGEWSTNWQPIDAANYNELNGVFTGTIILQDISDYQSIFAGMQAFIWVYNNTSPSPETEWFLASRTTGDPWVFPDISTCCPGPVTEWSITTLGAESPVWGNQGGIPGGGNFPDNGSYDLQTHVVPEPTTCLTVMVGSTLLLLRRKRANVDQA